MRTLSSAISIVLLILTLTTSGGAAAESTTTAAAELIDPNIKNRSFMVKDDQWYLDGKPIVVMSGSLHYFRIPPSMWKDRILRMKAMGLNTISAYVPWNFHELDFDGNVLDFTGQRDLMHFIDLVHENEMLLLIRPGPYICAEWDLGGLPARLLSFDDDDKDVRLRTNDERYMSEVTRWFEVLLPMIRTRLLPSGGGGPVVAVQVENEYGSFGNADTSIDDNAYLRALVSLFREHLGDEVVLFTTDAAWVSSMRGGSLPDDSVVTLGDFQPFPVRAGGGLVNFAQASIAAQNVMNPSGLSPPMCTEYYTGWLTHWGERITTTPSWLVAESLEYMLSIGMSVNLYMAHGGTSMGYWSGANGDGKAVSFDITSYDYNAPISESGAHNVGSDGVDKYNRLKEAFQKFNEKKILEEPPPLQMVALDKVVFSEKSRVSFLDWIKFTIVPVESEKTLAMEKLRQRFGFVLYSTTLAVGKEQHGNFALDLIRVSDRAQVYLDGKFLKTIFRTDDHYVVSLGLMGGGGLGSIHSLDILVENMGRINFGHGMYDPKGLPAGVTLDGNYIYGWTHYPVELNANHTEQLRKTASTHDNSDEEDEDCDDRSSPLLCESSDEQSSSRQKNVFYYGNVFVASSEISFLHGTYIDMSNFCKGYVWINDVNIGRYWTAKGPQVTLFVPGEYLRFGENKIVVMEIDGSQRAHEGVEFVSAPKWIFVEDDSSGSRVGDGSGGTVHMLGAQSSSSTRDTGRGERRTSHIHMGLGSFWT